MAKKSDVAVEITGLKQTIRSLKEFPDEIDEMKAVHQRVGGMVLEAARQRMPRDTGKLIDSYKVANIKRGAKITSSLIYSGVSEFGGTMRRHASSTRTKHKPTARNEGIKSYYIYPAVDEKRGEIVHIYEIEIASLARRHHMGG